MSKLGITFKLIRLAIVYRHWVLLPEQSGDSICSSAHVKNIISLITWHTWYQMYRWVFKGPWTSVWIKYSIKYWERKTWTIYIFLENLPVSITRMMKQNISTKKATISIVTIDIYYYEYYILLWKIFYCHNQITVTLGLKYPLYNFFPNVSL